MDIEHHRQSIAGLAKARTKQAARNKLSSDPKGKKKPRPGFDNEADGDDEGGAEDDVDELKSVEKRFEVAIVVKADEEQTVSGIVLQPEVVDAQGDIMSADVIKQAAYAYLAGFNKKTKLGLQHSSFPKGKLALVESYVAPNGIVLGTTTVKQGSWIMTVKVLDADVWKKVKDGKITGFSIGGKAKVVAVRQ